MFFLSACSHENHSRENLIAGKAVQDIACKNQDFETRFWDALKTDILEQTTLISVEDLKKAIKANVAELAFVNKVSSHSDLSELSLALEKLIDHLLRDAPKAEQVTTAQEILGLISAIDVGDRSTPFRSTIQDQVREDFAAISKLMASYNLHCSQSAEQLNQKAKEESAAQKINAEYELRKSQALAAGMPMSVFGQRWAFATAYQSCQSLELPSLSAETPGIQGISIVGKHPDGIGNKRIVANLSEVQSTHPYIKEMNRYGSSCFDVRNNPLIYDYGGKPSATVAESSPLNLFKNNGDGTSVLGIDCSGFVFTAMAAGGLKLKSGRPLKASDSWAWGSTSYLEPQNNGLTCLDKISVTANESIKAGDIVAVQGHVIIIDRVGEDPFGLRGAISEQDCEGVNSKKFNFVIAQSSPSIDGVGINHFEARDYLSTSVKMNTGLQKYAYYACLAKVNNKTYKPNLGTMSIVRHRGTADCLATRVTLSHEECIQTCNMSTFLNPPMNYK
jgi:hypothetical protein